MTKTFAFATAAAVAAVVGFAGPASAQLSRQTVIKGDVTQTSQAGTIVSVAIGQGAKSATSQSTIYEGTTIDGKVTQTAKADTIVSVAIGQGANSSAHQSTVAAPKP